MAFCTICGASVAGAFCAQCGTPVSASGGQAQPAPPPMSQAQPMSQPAPGFSPMPPAPAVPRKTSPIVWVLVILLGLFVLGVVGVVGTGFFVYHKARQAGLDPELMSRNPGLALSKLIVAANPDAEVLRTDDNAGTITIRNRKDGKVVTLNFDQVRNGQFKFSAQDETGQTATMEFGAGAGKLPSWVPSYPGSLPQGTFAVKGNSNDGQGEGGNFTFTTSDPPARVLSFYEDKAKELHMKVNLTTHATEGGMIIATDDEDKRNLTVVVGSSSGQTTINLTYAVKR